MPNPLLHYNIVKKQNYVKLLPHYLKRFKIMNNFKSVGFDTTNFRTQLLL